jgi:hypothetical protein
VLSGYDVVTAVEESPTRPGDRPVEDIKISACGLMPSAAGGRASGAARAGGKGAEWEKRVYGTH